MSRILRNPLRRLGALALVLAVVGSGCGYENLNRSTPPAPEKIPRASEKLPVRAVCEWRIDQDNDPLALYAQQGYPTSTWEKSGVATALDALGSLVTEAGLFEAVSAHAGLARDIRDGEVLVVVSEKTTAVPEIMESWRWMTALIPFMPLMALYTERDTPLTIDFEMRCLAPRGVLLARHTAQAKVFVNMQTGGNWMEHGRVEAEEMARAYAARVLAAKLAADDRFPEEVRRRNAANPAVAAADPTTSPVVSAPPVPPPSPPATGEGSVFVLVVGINTYADAKIPALRFAEPDAREVYAFFATERRSPTDGDRVQLVTGKAATRRGVREAIREHLVKKAVRPSDTAILYFAGHGFRDADDTYLACQDASIDGLPDTAISMEELRSLWSKIGGERKVLLVDACQSAAVGSVRGIGGVSLAPEGGPTTTEGTLAIAATGPNELSTEDETLGHGVFTIGLLKGLRGEADADRDGRVSGAELGAFVQVEVPRLAVRAGGRQTPVVTGVDRCAVFLSR